MIRMKVQKDALLKFRDYMRDEAPRQMKRSIVKALNVTGEEVVAALIKQVSDQLGISEGELREQITIRKATTANLKFEADLRHIYDQDTSSRDIPRGRRDPETRARESEPFTPGALVNVVTAGDEKVCYLCEDAADNGPYTLEESKLLVPHHPNCRCAVVPFFPKKRMPVTFSTSMGATPRGAVPQAQSVTLARMTQLIKDDLKFSLAAVGRMKRTG